MKRLNLIKMKRSKLKLIQVQLSQVKLKPALCGLVLSFTSLQGVAQVAPEYSTSMDIIADKQSLPCNSELRVLAQQALKKNPHRLIGYQEVPDDVHLYNALAVTQYRDRKSHVSFHGVKNSAGGCDTSVTESYVLQTSCSDARHEAFSKWAFEGRLDAMTSVLRDKRDESKQAFLTDQPPTLCLVTTRKVIFNPVMSDIE